MEALASRPNLLYLSWIRWAFRSHLNRLIITRLREPIYVAKLVKILKRRIPYIDYTTKSLIREEWYLAVDCRKLHRDNGPALTYYRFEENINYKDEYWYRNGLHHREDGPAVINRTERVEEWYLDGIMHRENGPALIHYQKNGDIEFEQWYFNGEHHRLDGPAVHGLNCSEWWIHGVNMSKPEFSTFIKNGIYPYMKKDRRNVNKSKKKLPRKKKHRR